MRPLFSISGILRSYAGAVGLASIVAPLQQLLKKRWVAAGIVCKESAAER